MSDATTQTCIDCELHCGNWVVCPVCGRRVCVESQVDVDGVTHCEECAEDAE